MTRHHSLGLNEAELAALTSSIRHGEYNLFLGAGVSLDSKDSFENFLPKSDDFRLKLCSVTKARTSSTLQRAFSALTAEQIDEHVTKPFANCTPGDSLIRIPNFIWRRVFTLNIDDALEKSYSKPGHLQEKKSFHFKDTYEEARTLGTVPIIHLHGWAHQPEKGYVFSRAEYARLMAETNAWMTVLSEVMPVEPFIIAGTALDEIDLDFYLARRNSISQRNDRGPSFFVEPFPDSQTENECARYGLTLYTGTILQFLEDLDRLAPQRAAPADLIPAETRELFGPGSPRKTVMAFASDFDRVPNKAATSSSATKFSYGHPPTWEDLAGNWDVGRAINSRSRAIIEAMLSGKIPERLLIMLDSPGKGKTTAALRIAYDFSKAGTIVLNCSALSRLDARSTAEALDLIDEKVIILVDNFADQATAIANCIQNLEKKDVIFLCVERSYRKRYIIGTLGGIPHRLIDGFDLAIGEAIQLIESYTKRGLTASADAAKAPHTYAKKLIKEPIAVACCHIINDMKPLDRIVDSTLKASNKTERDRYLAATLSSVCFSGGIRYEILSNHFGDENWIEQFDPNHPLPLVYSDKSREFINPLNATLAERTLAKASKEELYQVFVKLAKSIATRVNRKAIISRSPEARLSGRLFDYEDIIEKYIPNEAERFYEETKNSWRWNSRYWEQVALYNLSMFRVNKQEKYLQSAVGHARHAVAVEDHPFPLTTLGKVLFVLMKETPHHKEEIYSEAFTKLVKATKKERKKGRTSVHAYVTLFNGTIEYLEIGGIISITKIDKIYELISEVEDYFGQDEELKMIAESLISKLHRSHP